MPTHVCLYISIKASRVMKFTICMIYIVSSVPYKIQIIFKRDLPRDKTLTDTTTPIQYETGNNSKNWSPQDAA